ncbi:hypothetical protein PAXRUDRAFT_551414 [Paxillus rubicundulus Ve08.2h10]|uniref:Uncharacterized protein n=1 Tax=Paxillus rubicundulus Ve08.2h10 TaxID=930991 RepID=A0A0D0E5N6_9AGAM|nr:hypothetical protein PAXRUDRAFT_551414 [Paxillus rubicundulus Ve08.2h10]
MRAFLPYAYDIKHELSIWKSNWDGDLTERKSEKGVDDEAESTSDTRIPFACTRADRKRERRRPLQ